MPSRLTELVKYLLPALLVALISWYVVSLPQGREEEPVVSVDLSSPSLTLERDEAVTQTFLATGEPISGIKLFVPLYQLAGREVEVAIYNANNELLARGRPYRTEYPTNFLALIFSVKPVATQVKQPLRLAVTSIGKNPLPLLVNTGDVYASGNLQDSELGSAADLSFSLIHPTATSPATKQGVTVGLMVLLGSVLIAWLPRYRWLAAALLLIMVLPLAIAGFWFSTGEWGMSDWDYFASIHEGYRKSVVGYHAFPFWNPYTFGGVAGLGDPEFPVLSFNFLFELLFGTLIGFRLAIYAAIITCGLGLLVLSKRLGLSVHAALLTAIAYPLSTSVLLRFVEGHVQYFAIAWIPWIFWSWLCAYRSAGRKKFAVLNRETGPAASAPLPVGRLGEGPPKRHSFAWKLSKIFSSTNGWVIICGLFLSLTFYQGGIYILFYILPALILFIGLAQRPMAAGYTTLGAGVWSFGFSAFKVLPVFFWIKEFPDDFYHVSSFSLPYWVDMYLRRHLHGVTILPNQSGGWHEYGSYIGLVVFGLAIVALSQLGRTRIVRVLLVGIVITVLTAAAGPFLVPVFDVLTWLPRSNLVRMATLSVFTIVLLAGFGLDVIRRHNSHLGRYVVPALVGLVAIDIMSLAYPMSLQAFTVPPVVPPVEQAAYPIAYSGDTHEIRLDGSDEERTFASVLAGYGTVLYRPNIAPPLSVIPVGQAGSNYLQSSDSSADVQLSSWSPNQVRLEVKAQQPVAITLNSNYSRGWRMNGAVAANHDGRLGITVPAGHHRLIFTYRPPGYPAGLIITAVTVILAGTWYVFKVRTR